LAIRHDFVLIHDECQFEGRLRMAIYPDDSLRRTQVNIASKCSWMANLVAASLIVLLSACGGSGGTDISTSTTSTSSIGTLRLALTDAPSCGFDHVNVTVAKVRVHKSASAGESDQGWSEIVLTPAKRIDLLALTNGVLEELGQTALPAGKYTQMRLVLADNAGIWPPANSLVLSSSEVPLDTPSATQSGLKMNVDIDIEENKVADFVLDFDACKSVVTRGKSGKYNLKPVVRVIPRLSDAGQRIVGYVDMSVASTATTISVQSGGQVLKSTPPDTATGKFVLYPVPAGTYDLVITAPNRVTTLISGVPVVTTSYTYVGSDTVRILPPLSTATPPSTATSETASGTVSVGGSFVSTNASVRVLQPFSGVSGTPITKVEVAAKPVDGDDGQFTFTLPLGAPVHTAYSAGATAITFASDPPSAGLFILEAAAPNQTTQTQNIDLKTGPSNTLFTFP
jgi:hypothetical protein